MVSASINLRGLRDEFLTFSVLSAAHRSAKENMTHQIGHHFQLQEALK